MSTLLEEWCSYDPVALQPGEIAIFDGRANSGTSPALPIGKSGDGDGDGELLTALRVVDWNIERGYEIEKIVEHLQGLAADVIVLQELDIHCVRTRCLNIPLLLARALNMQCAFVCEFIELDSDVRDPINASGPNALHGNAILSKYPLEDLRAFPHSFDRNWAECGLRLREPRIGRRVVLHASVSSTAHTLHLYCLHTEIFCGMTNRARQIADAVYDARKQYEGFLMLQPHQRTRSFHVVITGDMNTIAHGVMRLSPNYANDRMRFLLCGETEAQWLYANVLSADGVSRNPIYGFTAEDRIRMDNRELMLCDPFDLYEDITLRHRWYGSLVQGKLDWFLTSNVEILSTAIGNHDCSASDHKFIVVDITLSNVTTPADTYRPWKPRGWRPLANKVACRGAVCVAFAALTVAVCRRLAPHSVRKFGESAMQFFGRLLRGH